MDSIRLGLLVKDKVSGFQGFVTSKLECSTGMIQYAVAPRWIEDKKEAPSGQYFDPEILEILDDGLSAQAVAPDAKLNVALGDEVEDTATSMRGIAIEKVTFLNGCTYFTFFDTRRNSIDGKPPRMAVDHRRLKHIAAAHILTPNRQAEEQRAIGTPKGGPSSEHFRP